MIDQCENFSALFQEWDIWAPHFFFNRETELISDTDRECARELRTKYFGDLADGVIPPRNEENLAKLAHVLSLQTFSGPLAQDTVQLFSRVA